MKETNLQTRLEMYLSLRESLGDVPAMHRSALESFVRYLSEHCDASNVRAQTAIDWARGPDRQRGACTQYVRLSLARGFLTYLKASCPETEIPGRNLIGSWRRPNPYIVPDSELERVLELISNRGKRTKDKDAQLWHYTCECMIALIACTGLRVREAINLHIYDVQLEMTPPALHIRKTKFKKSRWVPLHPTAAEKLRELKKDTICGEIDGHKIAGTCADVICFMLCFCRDCPPFLPAAAASSAVNWWAFPFSWAAVPPLLAISRCFVESIEANPRLLLGLSFNMANSPFQLAKASCYSSMSSLHIDTNHF